MPDAYAPLSARLIERAGFEAVQCSGHSMAIAQGYAAETGLSYSENLETTRRIVNAVAVPVMADGEDGFGDRTKLEQTIREFIAIEAGAELAFVTVVRTLDEARFLKEAIEGPLTLAAGLSCNLREMPVDALTGLGLAHVSLSTLLTNGVAQTMAGCLAALRDTGGPDGPAGEQVLAGAKRPGEGGGQRGRSRP